MLDAETLTDQGAVNALKRAAAAYCRRYKLDLPTLAKIVQAIIAVQATGLILPRWALQGSTQSELEVGPLARSALDSMLRSPPTEGLYAAATDAIAEEKSNRAHVSDIGFSTDVVIVALALLAKWSWSENEGHRFESGFPDLDKVLGKIGEILRNLRQ